MTSERWPQLRALLSDGARSLSTAAKTFVDAIADRPDLPERLAKMALMFRGRDDRDLREDARLLAWAAMQLAPRDYRVKVLTQWLVRREAPLWHFPMIHDDLRNQAYARALNHWVKPGMIVFEIGTGSGLLAMLAIRAGAAHVYTCERRLQVAEAAREIIASNGMTDRITVLAKDARTITLGGDMPTRAQLFVAEIVDDGLLGEYVLPLTRLAREKFLEPDAILLPRVVSTDGYLVSGRGHHQTYRMTSVMDFDLTPFNRFSPIEISAGIGGGDVEPLSDAVELLSFDLATDAPAEATTRVELTATASGVADGVMRWLKLDFGSGMTFDNRPPQRSVWLPQIHLFSEPRSVAPGDVVAVDVLHIQERLFIMDVA